MSRALQCGSIVCLTARVSGRCRTAGRSVVEDAIGYLSVDTPGPKPVQYPGGFQQGTYVKMTGRRVLSGQSSPSRPALEICKAARLNTSFQTCKVPWAVVRLRGKGNK